jgi:DNA-binding transcriptional ArsR family regulator
MTRAERPPVGCLDDKPVPQRELTDSQTAAIAKALSSPKRLAILELFHTRCPRTVGDIVSELPLAQSTVSAHLRILKNAGVVRTFRSGRRSWHCLNGSVIAAYAVAVNRIAQRATNPQTPTPATT